MDPKLFKKMTFFDMLLPNADHRRDLTLVKRRAQENVYWPSLNASPQVIH